MKHFKAVLALLGALIAVCLGAASPALATIQYNSDSTTNGFDQYANGTVPSGWVVNSGTWNSFSAPAGYLLPQHIRGFADGSRLNGAVATLTGITAISDTGVVASQIAQIDSAAFLQAIYVGVDGNSSGTQGYLVGAVLTSGTISATIYRKSGSAYTDEITTVAFTPASVASGTQILIHTRAARIGSTIYAKVWAGPASAEPAAWTTSYTDSSPLAAGYPWVFDSSSSHLTSGPFITDFAVDDTPYGETNSIAVTTPATATSAPFKISGFYQGTVPTGLGYALNGATSFTPASSPTIGGGACSFNLPSNLVGNYNQVNVQSANATTETATTGAAQIGVPPLTVGPFLTTPASPNGTSGILVTISAAAAGGSGAGFGYNIYRGTDPNFTEGAGNEIAAGVTSLTYTDTTAAPSVQYYYGVDAFDGGGDVAHSLPTGSSAVNAPTATGPFYQSAQLYGLDLIADYQGDSRTVCQYCSANIGTVVGNTPPYYADVYLQKALGLRNVLGFNGGCDGASSANWLKTAAPDTTCNSGTNLYTLASNAMTSLIASDPTAVQVFSIMLDANDANQSFTSATFVANMQSLIVADLTDFPSCKVFIHYGSFFSGSIYGGGPAVQSLAYSYRAPLAAMIATLQQTYPGRVYTGDTNSWNFFAVNALYASEMQAQTSYAGAGNAAGYQGTGYIHQIDTAGHNGSQDLGNLWGSAMASVLYGAVKTALAFRPGFH